jgi:TetR/AcrR family transcriptional regulator, repressor of fatR-cypB operon
MARPDGSTVTLAAMAEKRVAVLDAALAMFAERGFHGTSIPDVIARAKVGASTLYRLYPSKEALVNAVFVRAKESLERRLADALPPPSDPPALFRALWDRLVLFAQEEPVAFHFLELHDHTAYLDAQSRAVELRVLGPIFAACSELQAVGVLTRDVGPEVSMAFLWGAFVGLVKAERTAYIKLSPDAWRGACDAAWRAFAKDPASSTPKRHRRT